MHTPCRAAFSAAVFVASLTSSLASQTPAPPTFESTQVHPLDMSADGERLLVVNTPDARVCEFSIVDARRPRLLREIPVAAEPISIRFRTSDEAWVVSQLGDVVQVVDLDAGLVVDTLRVGDTPSDVAFAAGFAFVTLADPAEVVVLDASTRVEVQRVSLPCEEPRWALASRDGSKVWVAAHRSGNGTTLLSAADAPAQPAPTNPALPAPPQVARIVHSTDPQWAAVHGVHVADWDVFEFDAATRTVARRIETVGTTLFGMAERSQDGKLLVANTEALNTVRFEPQLRGHFVDNRLSSIDLATGAVTAVDLNAGIDYRQLPNPLARATSLAQPTDVALSPDQNRTYVAAFGSDRVGLLDRTGRVLARIEIGPNGGAGTVDPANKRGPRALAHHPSADVLYVLNRLANTVSVVDTMQLREVDEIELFDPTPAALKAGRGFLYDARLSGNGTASCASCHIDGGFDGLAWDLGDPSGRMDQVVTANGQLVSVHPMKGPMTTQTLRGLDVAGGLHWRGEKSGFTDFNGTFDALLGGSVLSTADMGLFRDFVATMAREPNPNRDLGGNLAAGDPVNGYPSAGQQVFSTRLGGVYQRQFSCADCHSEPDGTGVAPVDPVVTQLPQPFRPAVLREVYRRDGRGRIVDGRQISGFGLSFDGRHDHAVAHLSTSSFASLSAAQRRDLQAYLRAFDTGTHQTVGHVVAVDRSNHTSSDVVADLATMRGCAQRGDCDVVAIGEIDGRLEGLLWQPAGSAWLRDRAGQAALSDTALDGLLAQGRARLQFRGVPPGQGRAVALDRDGDGVLDGDALGVDRYGVATGAAPAEPRANRAPRLGDQDFAVIVDSAPADAQAAVLIGFARADVPVGAGLRLLIEPTTVVGFTIPTDGRGVGVLPMPLPSDPRFDGVALQIQAVTLDGQVPSASDGLTVTLQD